MTGRKPGMRGAAQGCVGFLLAVTGGAALAQAPSATPAPIEWRLAMTGDIMLGSDHPAPRLPPDQGRGLLDAAAPTLQWAGMTLGNLEGTLAAGGVSSKQNCGQCYAFRTPPAFAQRLAEAGFDGMSQANNHGNDFGVEGRLQTTQALANVGLAGTGWSGSAAALIRRNGQSMCLLAFAPNRGMNDLRDLAGAARRVRQTKPHCPLLVVSFHGGAEGSDKIRTPQGPEYHLGEHRGDVRAFSHAVIEAGADLVYGHGPHVPRGMELYRGHLIAYSLGNFMTWGGMNVSGVLGQAPVLTVRLDAQGRLIAGRVLSFRQIPHSPLRGDAQQGAWKTMRERTRIDFGGGGLLSDDEGRFWPATR